MDRAPREPWNEYAEILDLVRAAFPDSATHESVMRRWIMRRPERFRVDLCPACGQGRPDALSLPKRHHVQRLAGASSPSEETALAALGRDPGMGNRTRYPAWAAQNREIRSRPLDDLRFEAVDWETPPARLASFLAATEHRWICAPCVGALSVASSAAGGEAGEARALADLRRALEDGPRLRTVERWRADALPAAWAVAPCLYCRRTLKAFSLPWFQVCVECIEAATAACAPMETVGT